MSVAGNFTPNMDLLVMILTVSALSLTLSAMNSTLHSLAAFKAVSTSWGLTVHVVSKAMDVTLGALPLTLCLGLSLVTVDETASYSLRMVISAVDRVGNVVASWARLTMDPSSTPRQVDTTIKVDIASYSACAIVFGVFCAVDVLPSVQFLFCLFFTRFRSCVKTHR